MKDVAGCKPLKIAFVGFNNDIANNLRAAFHLTNSTTHFLYQIKGPRLSEMLNDESYDFFVFQFFNGNDSEQRKYRSTLEGVYESYNGSIPIIFVSTPNFPALPYVAEVDGGEELTFPMNEYQLRTGQEQVVADFYEAFEEVTDTELCPREIGDTNDSQISLSSPELRARLTIIAAELRAIGINDPAFVDSVCELEELISNDTPWKQSFDLDNKYKAIISRILSELSSKPGGQLLISGIFGILVAGGPGWLAMAGSVGALAAFKGQKTFEKALSSIRIAPQETQE